MASRKKINHRDVWYWGWGWRWEVSVMYDEEMEEDVEDELTTLRLAMWATSKRILFNILLYASHLHHHIHSKKVKFIRHPSH
jgi:hypothetical protein